MQIRCHRKLVSVLFSIYSGLFSILDFSGVLADMKCFTDKQPYASTTTTTLNAYPTSNDHHNTFACNGMMLLLTVYCNFIVICCCAKYLIPYCTHTIAEKLVLFRLRSVGGDADPLNFAFVNILGTYVIATRRF